MNEYDPYEQPQQSYTPPYVSNDYYGAAPMPPQKKKKRGGAWVVVVALCFSLLGSALGAGGVLLVNGLIAEKDEQTALEEVSTILQGRRESSVIQIAEIDTGTLMTPAEVYSANVNSTVGITTSITTNFWGYQTTSAASGSGFIISDDGYILTNYHVIEDSDSITVSLYSGEAYEAALIGYDESNDIAVLKIEAKDLTPVILGDSDNLNIGDSVVAIGNPLGELTFSLTSGTISAKDREVTLSSTVTMNLLQTDCAINSGNSGGALFNLYGEVIGVTNAKYSSSGTEASIDNIGFAIPINSIRSIVESIIEKGYISKPYLGVSVSNVSEESQSYGLPQGAAVKSVADDGPAKAAGLQSGDIITAVNGTEITGSSELVELVGNCAVGDTLQLTVYRQGQTLTMTVVIQEQIQSALANEDNDQPQQYQQSPYGGQGSFPWYGFGSY